MLFAAVAVFVPPFYMRSILFQKISESLFRVGGLCVFEKRFECVQIGRSSFIVVAVVAKFGDFPVLVHYPAVDVALFVLPGFKFFERRGDVDAQQVIVVRVYEKLLWFVVSHINRTKKINVTSCNLHLTA